MAKINIKIEGQSYQVEEGLTILEAAKECGYEIPSLCAYNHGECSLASCRVCLVEATGARGLVASCVYPISEGMEITISSPKATAARRASVELILSNHSMNCQQCEKNGHCELLVLVKINLLVQKLQLQLMKFLHLLFVTLQNVSYVDVALVVVLLHTELVF